MLFIFTCLRPEVPPVKPRGGPSLRCCRPPLLGVVLCKWYSPFVWSPTIGLTVPYLSLCSVFLLRFLRPSSGGSIIVSIGLTKSVWRWCVKRTFFGSREYYEEGMYGVGGLFGRCFIAEKCGLCCRLVYVAQ